MRAKDVLELEFSAPRISLTSVRRGVDMRAAWNRFEVIKNVSSKYCSHSSQ